jgi:colicin import membrane protein
MSTAEEATNIQLPVDPELLESRVLDEKIGPVRWGAIVVAILFHATVLIVLNLPDRWLTRPIPAPPTAIPVTLVQAPPAPPPPAPKQAPQPKPTPPVQKYAESGKDQETTAPPKEAEKKPEEAAPEAKSLDQNQVKSATGEAAAKEAPAPQKPKPKVATRETTPDPKRSFFDRAPGEERTGDPYLNSVSALIERHRFYPPNAVGSLGLPLQGLAIFHITVAPDGRVLRVALARSSGAEVLDEVGRKMIEQSSPFPRLPNNFAQEGGAVLVLELPIFPLGR